MGIIKASLVTGSCQGKQLKGRLLSAAFDGVSLKNNTTKPLSPLAACPLPSVDVITIISHSTFFSLNKSLNLLWRLALTSCNKCDLCEAQACATVVFLIFALGYGISNTGLGSHCSAPYLSMTLHGREVSGWLPLRQVCCRRRYCWKSAERVGLWTSHIRERAAARSISFLPDLDVSDFP